MSSALAERAAAIRHFRRNHADQAWARRYSFIAARFEEMKLRQLDSKTTPAEDARFREVERMLKVLTGGDKVVDVNGFLPGDPQRIIFKTWREAAEMWFR